MSNSCLTYSQKGSSLGSELIEISASNIRSIPVITKTGKDFGCLVMATVVLKDGSRCDVLYDARGEPVLNSPFIEPLAKHYNKSFTPGLIDGQHCLINQIT